VKVQYRKKFLTDLARIPASERKAIEKFAFEDFPALNSVAEIGKVERLKGSRSCYKVRFGSYRIGLKLEHDTASFERVLHRREIYRFFP
jgi:mRNA interferase RelE/StbE